MKNNFRLWEKEKMSVIYPDWVYGQDMGENTDLIVSYLAGEMCGVSDEFQERYVLQQSTGVRDRHNELIYEGDILKVSTSITLGEDFFESKDFDVQGTFEVYYNEKIAAFDLKLIDSSHKDFIGYTLVQEWSNEFEISGNICDLDETEKMD